MRTRCFVRRAAVCFTAAAAVFMISTPNAGSVGLANAAGADWPTFHFDPAHSGANPYESLIGVSNVGSLVRRWSFHETNTFSATASGGLLYVYGYKALVALHAKTGSVAWSVSMVGDNCVPTVADGRVFVLPGDNLAELDARDAATGALDWSTPLDDVSFETSPTVSGGRVFLSDRDGRLYAFDEATGARDWRAHTPGLDASPAVADGVVFAGSASPGRSGDATGGLFAFDAATGRRLWPTTCRPECSNRHRQQALISSTWPRSGERCSRSTRATVSSHGR